MHKRLPLLAICLTAAAFGASACGPSGESEASASATPAAASSAPASAPAAAPSGSPSASAEVRGLTGLPAKLYLKTIRDNAPDLDRISDDVLVTHGNALCLAQGKALVDQAIKTKEELGLTGKQASQILGSAHGVCGRNAFK
ncbi:hypothetical protein AB0G83_27255 [Streptomyces klenkii]|uniref:hypothetical protein n=1 Tax=Streptomyces klenkii TaxID=1420899 RepID=UPI001319C1D3|nr:hypothetical protein [Streptomyces klenkii]